MIALGNQYRLETLLTNREQLLDTLGFRFGRSGPHAARTMMLEDLRAVFLEVAPEGLMADYIAAIVERNVLGKPTKKLASCRADICRHSMALIQDMRFFARCDASGSRTTPPSPCWRWLSP